MRKGAPIGIKDDSQSIVIESQSSTMDYLLLQTKFLGCTYWVVDDWGRVLCVSASICGI